MTTTDNTKLSFIIENDIVLPFWDGTILFSSTDGITYLYYIADTGLGMPPVVRLTQRGPFQHGDSDIDYRLEPRVISYIFGIYAPSLADLETARDLLLRLFRPSNTPFIVQYERSNNSMRQLYAHFMGGMQLASSDREQGSWFQRFSIDIRAADPTFFDPFMESVSILNTVSGGMTIPLSVPVNVRSDAISTTLDIHYIGTADTLPIITLYGPVYKPIITNTVTGAVISFPSTDIQYGDYYQIDLRNGFKTVTDSAGIDHTQELSETSSLEGWAIIVQYLPQRISFSASYVGAQTEIVRIAYNVRYIGL